MMMMVVVLIENCHLHFHCQQQPEVGRCPVSSKPASCSFLTQRFSPPALERNLTLPPPPLPLLDSSAAIHLQRPKPERISIALQGKTAELLLQQLTCFTLQPPPSRMQLSTTLRALPPPRAAATTAALKQDHSTRKGGCKIKSHLEALDVGVANRCQLAAFCSISAS
jgi:hypothetical protein